LEFAVHSLARSLSEFYVPCESLEGSAAALALRNAVFEDDHPVPDVAGASETPGPAEQEEH